MAANHSALDKHCVVIELGLVDEERILKYLYERAYTVTIGFRDKIMKMEKYVYAFGGERMSGSYFVLHLYDRF